MPQIPFLVEYGTEFDSDLCDSDLCDSDLGGFAVVYAEDEGEALLKSENYCQSAILEEIEDDEGQDIVVDIIIREFNNLKDGDIRDFAVID